MPLFFVLLSCQGWSACPLFTYPENHKLDQEVNNICDNILNPVINSETVQSETVKSLAVSTITLVSSFTVTNATITNATVTSLTVGNGNIVNSCGYIKGTIIQLGIEGTTATGTTNATSSFVDATNLTVTITPKCSTSILRIRVTAAALVGNVLNGKCDFDMRIVSGSSTVIRTFNEALATGGGAASADNVWANLTLFAEDSPATTSAITYKVQFRNSAGNTSAINDTTISSPNSYITIDEVAQ